MLGRLVVAMAAVFLAGGAVLGSLGWSDLAMLRDWPRSEATVVEITTRRHWRGTEAAELTLLADTPSGRVEGRTIRPVASAWFDPHPVPARGDRVAVVMDPRDPRRMATVGSLEWSWPAIGTTVVALVLGVTLAASAVIEWLRRR